MSKKILPGLRFSEFDNYDWKKTKLGKLVTEVNEKVGDDTYLLMSVTSGVGLVLQVEKFGREIAGDSYKNYIVIRKYDFAYNKSATKQFPEGYLCMLSEYEAAAIPKSIFTCFRIIDSECYPDFLDYLFHNNYHGRWLRKYIEVGARAHGSLSIDTKYLWMMPIAMPCLREQQKIADCLASVDVLIKAETKKLELLKKYKRGLMQKLFPAQGKTVPEWRFREFRDCGEWEETVLEKVSYYENGKAHENSIEENGTYIVVNSKFISTDGAIKKYSNAADMLAARGDILMVLSDVPNGKALAKCYFVRLNNTYTVNQRVCRLTPHNVNGVLLFYILNRNAYFLRFDDGVKQTNLKKADVLSCLILIPKTKEEQQKIADVLSETDAVITAQSNKIKNLRRHKKGLMQGLFPSSAEVDE